MIVRGIDQVVRVDNPVDVFNTFFSHLLVENPCRLGADEGRLFFRRAHEVGYLGYRHFRNCAAPLYREDDRGFDLAAGDRRMLLLRLEKLRGPEQLDFHLTPGFRSEEHTYELQSLMPL